MEEGWTIVRSVSLIANERFLKLIENTAHGVSLTYFNNSVVKIFLFLLKIVIQIRLKAIFVTNSIENFFQYYQLHK